MKKILILEDDEDMGEMYQESLEDLGYEVMWVKRSETAEKCIRTFIPDLALVDHGLEEGDKSGIEVLPSLKKTVPNIFLILLSNFDTFELREQAFTNGADEYWLKLNYTPDTLAKKIKKIVG